MTFNVKSELDRVLSIAKEINSQNILQYVPEWMMKPPYVNEVNIVDFEYIFRAKCFEEWRDEFPTNRFSYAPESINPPLSRANWEGQSVFYWWTDLRSTSLEMKDNRFEDMHISFWKLKNPRWYRFCFLSSPEYTSNEEESQRIFKEEILPKVNQNIIDVWKFYDQVFTSNRADIYNLSTAISNYLMYTKWYDWVIFRSSEADKYSRKFNNPEALYVMKNIAIKPSFVDKNMELAFVFKWKQKEICDSRWVGLKWKFDMVGFPQNWKIVMRELNKEEDEDFLRNLFTKSMSW